MRYFAVVGYSIQIESTVVGQGEDSAAMEYNGARLCVKIAFLLETDITRTCFCLNRSPNC